LNDTYRRKNGRRLEGDALAHHIARDIRGKLLNMVYMRVKHAGLKIRVHKVDGVVASQGGERDMARINIELNNGLISNAWVG
jgi:hypothetical protein